MRKLFFSTLFSISLLGSPSFAQQTVAYDFNMTDCSGNWHHLFSDLDSGYVVVMEYFMLSCSPCIDAGDALEPMINKLKATCSNKIKFYHFGYTNSYTCASITNWVSINGYTSIPIDSGGVQTAYYGGMGMPTIAVAAGNTHKILHTSVGFLPADTALVADSIRTFFGCNAAGVGNDLSISTSVSVYPNPSSDGIFKVQAHTVSSSANKVENLQVFDLLGQQITDLSFNKESGILTLYAPDGIYFMQGEVSGEKFSRKISVIR